jgi:hypothetical protein
MQPPVQMALPVNSRDVVDVDTILDRAITAGDPLIAAEYGNQLSNTITLKGIALAKLFYGLKSNWELFRASGIEEDFADFIDAHMQVSGQTADKYANMYEAVFVNPQIPQELKGQLAHKPIQSLLLLTAAVREGSFDSEDLEDVVVLDHNGIRAKVREARGEATSSRTAVHARLVQRTHSVYPKGTIVVFGTSSDGHEEIEAIGYLKLDEARTESGKKYIQRIINALGLEDIR